MASIPPPPDQPTQPIAPPGQPAPPGPSSRTTIIAILVSVAVIATIGTVVALANSGGGDNAASQSASAAAGVAPIQALTAHTSPNRVELAWTSGEGTPAAHYVVSRNGTVATTLDAAATSWVDTHVLPESRYSYAVQAVGPDGTKATTHVTAKTKSAPLSTAPLKGVFNVHLHATSHYGFSDFGAETGNLGWRFTPTCSKGPCDTRLADLHQKDLRLTLGQKGVTYHGTATVHGLVRCGGTAVASSITVDVHVTDAGVLHNMWVARKIQGTMSQFESQQLGCVASGASFDVTGKVVG